MATVHRHSFTRLNANTQNDEQFYLNVVFIHGLRGHPRGTWETTAGSRHGSGDATKKFKGLKSLFKRQTGRSSGTDTKEAQSRSASPVPSSLPPSPSSARPTVFWPEEYLTQDIPQARIWTYGYNADVIGGLFQANNKNSISQHGRDLSVRLEREIDNGKPLAFVVHSLGGIILKDAIRRSEKVRDRTKLVLFLGTPHRGSAYAGWGQIASNLARLALQDSNKKILETLEVNNEVLDNIHEEFKTIAFAGAIKIHSFQEAQGITGMKGVSEKVVDDFSSKLDLPRALETVESIDANHMQMARYSSRDDQGYRAISGVLQAFVRQEAESEQILPAADLATKSDQTSSNQSLSETERSCMVLLNSIYLAEYKSQLPKPVQGTCSWILSHPAYLTWLTAEETRLLWVTGEPGCGKTMLSAYLTDHLRLGPATPVKSQVFFFFCDDKVKSQRDANAILRGIIYQILQQHRKLIKHVKSRFELDGHSLANSFPALWELFLKMIADSTSGAIGVIVDAIDECETKTRNSFLNAMMQLVNEAQDLQRQPQNCIKFLITSRPSLGNSHNLTGRMENRLSIDQNQSGVSEDVKLVIRSKVGEIATKFHCDNETKNYLERVLYSKSDQSFLWLSMVLHSLEGSSRASKRDFERIINTFPPNLEATYSRFLRGISSGDQEDARKILRLLIGSSRHLTLVEMNMAFTIDQGHKSVADALDDLQLSIRSTLQNIVGSFIRIKGVNQSLDEDSKVSLIHQSAKEYLTDLARHSTDSIVQSLAVPLVEAALSISQSCIRYLLMEEFQADVFASERTSLETNSSSSSHSFPVTDFDKIDLGSPLGLDHYLGLDDFFKDSRDLDEEQCTLISQRYTFFDYSATHWAEHYSFCESIAPKSVREAVQRLTANSSCVLTNWLKYYWCRTNMEYSFPESFERIEVAAFFNLSILLAELMEKAEFGSEASKIRALFWAARMSSLKCIKILLHHGANPNGIGIDRQTPLAISAQYGYLDAILIFLSDLSTDVTVKAKSGRSALSFAAGSGHFEIVEALLERGAFRLDDQDNTGWTPLFWAVQGDYASILGLLLEQPSVDINQVDKSGRSILSWAAGEGARRALKVILRNPSVNLNLKDDKGRSALSWAAGNGQKEVVMTLLHRTGIEKASKDNDLRNAISWACQGGHTGTLRTLLKNECGGENDVDIDTWTPLQWALFIRSPATIEVLLSTRRVQIDRQDGYGRTALIWAASYGYLDVVQLLLSWKASLHIRNQAGHTAADVARLEGQIEVLEFLEAQRGIEEKRNVDL